MAIPAPFRAPRQPQLEKELSSGELPTLLYFYDSQSNLCQLIEPAVVSVAAKYQENFKFIAARVSSYRDYFYRLGMSSCPAFIIFRGSEEIRRFVRFKYNTNFREEYEKFLVGDFLFNASQFEILDAVTMPYVINTGKYYHMTAFLNPTDPINWKLSRELEKIAARQSSKVKLSLVNKKTAPALLKAYNIRNYPSVLLFKKGVRITEWTAIKNLTKFSRDCEAVICGE